MRNIHNLPPDLSRQAAAHSPVHGFAVVVANPNAGRQVTGVANEPSVAEILRRARLAGGRMISDASPLPRARHQRIVQHVVHRANGERIDDLLGARHVAGKEHATRTHAHAADSVRLDCRAAVAEDAVGAGHFKQRHL